MGVFSSLRKGVTRGAKSADEVADARKADEFVSSTDEVRDLSDEVVSGVNYADQSYSRRLAADISGRLATGSTPAAIVGEAGKASGSVVKVVSASALGLGGFWALSNASENYAAMKATESAEGARSAYEQMLLDIENDSDLTDQQKAEAKADARELYLEHLRTLQSGGGPGGSGIDKTTIIVGVVALLVAANIYRRFD